VIELGESVELTISLSGPVKSIPRPSLPDLSEFDVYSSGTSSNISIVPGAINYQTIYSYVLVPRKAGDYVIQPATVTVSGKTYATTALTLKVQAASPSKPSPPPPSTPGQPSGHAARGQDFFIEQAVDSEKPFVGQQVVMTFRFYQGGNLYEQPSLKWPDYQGVWLEDLPPQKTYSRIVNGRTYRVTEIRRALFPTVSGKLIIGPTELTIPSSAFRFPFNDPFDLFANRRRQQPPRDQLLRSNGVTLDVRPLPEADKPTNFTGAVGSFGFTVQVDKDTAEIDQPISLKAVLSGKGNIKKLPGIDIPTLENFRLYDSGSNENISTKNYEVSGSKSYEWVLIPTSPGEYSLPELSFNFFDPKTGKYKTLTPKPGNVIVRPSSVASSQPDERSVNLIPAGSASLNYIVTDPGSLRGNDPARPIYARKVVWAVQVLPIVWLAVLAVFVRRQRRLEGDIAYARRKTASKAARRALKQAHDGLGDPVNFYSSIYAGIVGFVSDKLNITASGLTNDQIIAALKKTGKCDSLIDGFSDFLDECDAGRFSPAKPSGEKMREIYRRAENLLTLLDRGLR